MIIYEPPVQLTQTSAKVAFLTGLSNPESCSLHRTYHRFMAALECPEACKVYLNFPYLPGEGGEENEPLWRASLANVRQFVAARSSRYRKAAQRHLEHIAASAERLVLIVGSCGLEILNQAWTAHLDACDVQVFAWGPIAWSRPQARHVLIQGSRDHLSRRFFPEVDVLLPGVGHMDYVRHPQVFTLINDYLCCNISRS